MPERVEIRRGIYHDSVVLMRISSQLRALDQVDESLVAMATPLNLSLLSDLGFAGNVADGAGSSDFLVAVRAASEDALDAAYAMLETLLASNEPAQAGGDAPVHDTVAEAVRGVDANLVVISLPGAHVVPDAVDALYAGANVMLFSDGVSLDEERALKRIAEREQRLVMGPDCGTAKIGDAALGFCNVLSPGAVSLVAASGTGAQHLACLLDARGIGIRHILGVGGRDMSDDIGGVSTFRALQWLAADDGTEHVVIVSKAPGEETARRLAEQVESLGKPVTLALLGDSDTDLTRAAGRVAEARSVAFDAPRVHRPGSADERRGGDLAGLFSGGTLATEAAHRLTATLPGIAGLDAFASPTPAAFAAHEGHLLVDLGDDRLTVGRAHPMIDATVRREVIDALARAARPRLLLLDIVLGYGADDDPAGALAPSLARFLEAHRDNHVVVSLVGSRLDPQDHAGQWDKLAALGCEIHESNARAADSVAARFRTGDSA